MVSKAVEEYVSTEGLSCVFVLRYCQACLLPRFPMIEIFIHTVSIPLFKSLPPAVPRLFYISYHRPKEVRPVPPFQTFFFVDAITFSPKHYLKPFFSPLTHSFNRLTLRLLRTQHFFLVWDQLAFCPTQSMMVPFSLRTPRFKQFLRSGARILGHRIFLPGT